jgi:hypothetical protein
MAIQYTTSQTAICRIYQLFSFQGPPNFTQIVSFGLKTCIPYGNPASEASLKDVDFDKVSKFGP